MGLFLFNRITKKCQALLFVADYRTDGWTEKRRAFALFGVRAVFVLAVRAFRGVKEEQDERADQGHDNDQKTQNNSEEKNGCS